MNFLDRLNLRPHERRLVVIVALVLFLVVNILWVWPRFNDWSKVKADLARARVNTVKFQNEIAQKPAQETKLKKLEGEGSAVLPEEQAIQLRRLVENQIARSGVVLSGINAVPRASGGPQTSFFEEQSITVGFVNTGEQELVDFLYNIASGNSMIRVRGLTVKPDAGKMKLQGQVTLTASYQKKAAKPAAAPSKSTTNAPAKAPAAKKT